MAYTKAYIWTGMEINPTHMRLAIRRSIGEWTTYAPAHCPYHGTGAAAHPNDRITATHHAITCTPTGLASKCHNDVAANVILALQSAGVGASSVRKEQTSCFDGPGAMSARAEAIAKNKTFRMDLVISPGSLASAQDEDFRDKTILLDITVPNPAAVSHILHHSDRTAGIAAAAGEKLHRDKYTVKHGFTFAPATSTLVAFAIESYGRLGGEATHFIDELVEHGSQTTGQSRSRLVAKTYQRLSVALQRALSRRECAYIDKLRDRGTVATTTCAAELLWDVQLGGPYNVDVAL